MKAALALLSLVLTPLGTAQDGSTGGADDPTVQEPVVEEDADEEAADQEAGDAEDGDAPSDGVEEDGAAVADDPLAAPELVTLVDLAAQRAAGDDRHDPLSFQTRWRDALRSGLGWARVEADAAASPALAAEYDWIARYCAAESVLARIGAWRVDPAWHLVRIGRAVDRQPADPEQWDALITALEAVPAELLRTRDLLGRIPEAYQVEGLLVADELEALFRRPLMALANRAGLPLETLAELERGQLRAVRAIEAFQLWLLDEADVADLEPERLPGGGWRTLAEQIAGSPVDVEELRIQLLRSISELEVPLPETPDEVPDPQQALEAGVLQGLTLARAIGWMQGEDPPPPVRVRSAPFSVPFASATRVWSDEEGTWGFEIQSPGPAWGPQAVRLRQAYLDTPGLYAIAMIHGAPGELRLVEDAPPTLLQLERLGQLVAGTDLRATLVCGLGWLTSTQLADSERELTELLPPVVDALRRARRDAIVRALAGLELHERKRPLERVRADMALWTGWDAWTIERELTALLRDPRRGLGVLRALELERFAVALGRERESLQVGRDLARRAVERLPWAPTALLRRMLR